MVVEGATVTVLVAEAATMLFIEINARLDAHVRSDEKLSRDNYQCVVLLGGDFNAASLVSPNLRDIVLGVQMTTHAIRGIVSSASA